MYTKFMYQNINKKRRKYFVTPVIIISKIRLWPTALKMRNPILVHCSTCAQRRLHDFNITPFTPKKKIALWAVTLYFLKNINCV